MEIATELLTFSLAVIMSAISIAYYMEYKGHSRDKMVQGVIAVVGGLIIFISLFLPWVVIETSEIIGLDVGKLLIYTANTQFIVVATYFLLFLATLLMFGGFLQILGYKSSKDVIRYASGLALFISVIITLAISIIPQHMLFYTLKLSPWVCIFGAVIGLISTRLEK